MNENAPSVMPGLVATENCAISSDFALAQRRAPILLLSSSQMDVETTKRMPAPGMTIAELLELYPECAIVLNERGMACAGCELSAFETLADAARTYGAEEGRFLEALKAVVGSTPQNR